MSGIPEASGGYAHVHKGTYKGQTVAIKRLKFDEDRTSHGPTDYASILRCSSMRHTCQQFLYMLCAEMEERGAPLEATPA